MIIKLSQLIKYHLGTAVAEPLYKATQARLTKLPKISLLKVMTALSRDPTIITRFQDRDEKELCQLILDRVSLPKADGSFWEVEGNNVLKKLYDDLYKAVLPGTRRQLTNQIDQIEINLLQMGKPAKTKRKQDPRAKEQKRLMGVPLQIGVPKEAPQQAVTSRLHVIALELARYSEAA